MLLVLSGEVLMLGDFGTLHAGRWTWGISCICSTAQVFTVLPCKSLLLVVGIVTAL
jgi:hypothetical protein